MIVTVNGNINGVLCGPLYKDHTGEKRAEVSVQDGASVSDGYHTFDELYEHRIELFLALCREVNATWEQCGSPNEPDPVWRSRTHSDGTSMEGWFVMGLGRKSGEQITYHLPDKYWDRANIGSTLDKAPEFDGHTSADVLKRLADV